MANARTSVAIERQGIVTDTNITEMARFTIDDVSTPFVFHNIVPKMASNMFYQTTFSAWVKTATSNSTGRILIGNQIFNITDTWKRIEITMNNYSEHFSISFIQTGTYDFACSQLEIGNKATDYKFADADTWTKDQLLSEITQTSSTISTKIKNLTDGRFTTVEQNVAGLTITVGQKADQSYVDKAFEFSSQGLTIGDKRTGSFVGIKNLLNSDGMHLIDSSDNSEIMAIDGDEYITTTDLEGNILYADIGSVIRSKQPMSTYCDLTIPDGQYRAEDRGGIAQVNVGVKEEDYTDEYGDWYLTTSYTTLSTFTGGTYLDRYESSGCGISFVKERYVSKDDNTSEEESYGYINCGKMTMWCPVDIAGDVHLNNGNDLVVDGTITAEGHATEIGWATEKSSSDGAIGTANAWVTTGAYQYLPPGSYMVVGWIRWVSTAAHSNANLCLELSIGDASWTNLQRVGCQSLSIGTVVNNFTTHISCAAPIHLTTGKNVYVRRWANNVAWGTTSNISIVRIA